MKRDFKRVVSAALATVMVAQAGGVSALAAPLTTQSTTTTSATPTAAGMHQFTGTPALIQSAIEDLKAQGVTAEEKKEDKALVNRVETASDKSYDTVKSDLAQALIAQREDGAVDVSDLGLTQKDMATVLQETLYDKYMNHAVTDVTYQTEGGKVTGINYNMSEGFAAAMDAIDDEQQAVEVDTDAVASEVAEQAAQEGGQPAAIALFDAEDDDAVASGDSDGENGSGDAGETTGCKNHTVGSVSYIREDVNRDGEVNSKDLAAVRRAFLNGVADEGVEPDANGDGEINSKDLSAIRQVFLGNADPTEITTGSEIKFDFEEVADTTPIPKRDEKTGEVITDASGNPVYANAGLIYDVENHKITQGILPDYSYKLSKISFTCSECGKEIVIDDSNVLSQLQMTKDVYVYTKSADMNNPDMVQVDHGAALTDEDIKKSGKQGTTDDYILTTDVQIGYYMDDTFDQSTGAGMYTDSRDNGTMELQRYYAQFSAFNADNAEYLGVSTPFWTSKNSESNPMAAVKFLCNLDPDQQIPPAQMIQMIQMLPQAFMAYVYYYGAELLAMRDQAMAVVDALPSTATEVQKQLVLHDWLADNCTFDMGVMTNVTADGGNPQTDPIQMTTFGSLLSDQLSEMPTYADDNGNQKSYYGAICLGYTAAYTYLIQNMHPEVYKTTDANGKSVWKTPKQVGDDDLVDFVQAKFYADTAETSVAGDGFGGGAFNNVHYMNAVRLKNAPNASDGEWFYTDVCYDDIYIECMAQYRGEAQGSIYHTYFLMSPQSIAALYEKGKSIDYIDSLYDGYTYQVVTDKDGNIVPSENIDSGKSYYDKTHPKYKKVETSAEKMNDNTCYEDSWFSGAVSRVYYDKDTASWYYVDGGKTMASQRQSVENSDDNSQMKNMMDKIDKEAYTHSNRVNVENSDKLKSRSITEKDYWEDNSNNNNPMGNSFSKKEDPYAKTLFDYGTGKFTNTEAPVLEAEAKQDFAFTEQYPCLTHSIGLYDGKIYFNLANRIYTYDIKTNSVALFKEYNEVSYVADGRAFKATGFTVSDSNDATVLKKTPKPIASLEIYDDYDFSQGGGAYEFSNSGATFKAENLKSYPTLVVNIATDLSFSYPDTANGYVTEAVNYNPDYQRQVSSDNANKNGEFLWCANIRDTAKMDDLLSDLESSEGTDTKIPANCYTAEHTLTLTDKYGLVMEDKGSAEGAEPKGHTYKYNETENMYICETCGQHASVLLNAGEGGTAVMTSVADTGMGELLDSMGSMGSSMGLSKTATSIDPEREAATKGEGEITLTATPDKDYEVDKAYYVAEGSDEQKELTANEDGTYTINKTAGCIRIYVTFKEKEAESHKVNIDTESIKNGKVTADPTEAKAGNMVTLTVEPGEGYELKADSLVVSYEAPAETETQADDTETPEAPKTETKTVKLTAGEKENTWTFEMPAYDVKVTAKFVETKVEPEAHKIAVTEPEHGAVTVKVGETENATEAAKDATFTVTATASDGYEVDEIHVAYKDAEGMDRELSDVDGVYTMPDADVTVTVTFKEKVTEPTDPTDPTDPTEPSNPGETTPGGDDNNSGTTTPGEDNSGETKPGEDNSGETNPGENNSGDDNSNSSQDGE